MAIPKPGESVRGSETGAPVMVLLDLLGRKWALGIIWNMGKEPMTFRQIQSKCEFISPGVLNSRIKELREAGIVKRTLECYILEERGIELQELIKPLGKWSNRWALDIFNYKSPLDC